MFFGFPKIEKKKNLKSCNKDHNSHDRSYTYILCHWILTIHAYITVILFVFRYINAVESFKFYQEYLE